jgi:hypothetical protein
MISNQQNKNIKMNKSRITISAVLTLIGILVFGLISFFGTIYLQSGNLKMSILYPAVYSFGLLLTIVLATYFKSQRFNFQKNALRELIFILLYIVISVFSVKGFVHFFTVQERKKEIGTKIEENISNVENMFVQYEERVNERVLAFDGFLDATIVGKNSNQPLYLKYFVVGGPNESFQKNNKINFFKDDLKPAEYDTMKFLALEWLKKSRQTILDIKPVGIIDVLNNFESNSNEWYAKIKEYDKTINTFTDEAVPPPFNYNLNFMSINDELTVQKAPTLKSIIYLLLTHLLILFVYLLAIRDGKSLGFFKSLFSKEQYSDGDL